MPYCKFLEDNKIIKDRTKYDSDYVSLLEQLSQCWELLLDLQQQINDLLNNEIFNRPIVNSIEWDEENQWEQESYIATIHAEDPNNSNMTYELQVSDPNVAVNQDQANPNVFYITYPKYKYNIAISYTAKVTNDEGFVGKGYSFILVHSYSEPIIDSIDWDDNDQYEQSTYTMTILAHSEHGFDLDYEVHSNDINIVIEQDNTDKNKFHITYPNYSSNTAVTFNVIVTDEKDGYTSKINVILVKAYLAPIIEDIDWSSEEFTEQHTYTMVIHATDPQGFPLTYQVMCSDSTVTIEQDPNNHNVFTITYGDYSDDTTIIYTIIVTSDKNLGSSVSEGVLVRAYKPPIIQNISWNEENQWEQNEYTLTITAVDPNNLPLAYTVACNNPHVTITQNPSHDNIFNIEYGDFSENTTVEFNIVVMDTANESANTSESILVHAYQKPSITNIEWDSNNHWEQHSYVMTITAHDPQGLDLSYQVTCSDSNVTINQDANENVFHITYGNYSSDTTIAFNVSVSNSQNLTDSRNVNITVHAFKGPSITNITWDNTDQWENHSYVMTIGATDPQGLDLTYQVTCNDSSVNITQDANENVFHITYGTYNTNTTVTFNVTVTNTENLSATNTINMLVHAFQGPVIDSITWDDDDQWEQHSYVMTITAHDPQGLDLSYTVTASNNKATVSQDPAHPNRFNVEYGSLTQNTTISYTVTVTNTEGGSTNQTINVLVSSYQPPNIVSIQWNHDTHYEQESYDMTIIATDPQGLDLSYQVTCNDANVTVTQDTSNENKFHITYPAYNTSKDVTYTIKVTNSNNQFTTKTETKTVQVHGTPEIVSIQWQNSDHETIPNNCIQYEEEGYYLVVEGRDPDGLDLTYTLTCDDNSVQIDQNAITPGFFSVVYNRYNSDKTVTYTITIENTVNKSATMTITKNVKIYTPPVIDSITWDEDEQWEQRSYTATVNAHDVNDIELEYSVKDYDSSVVTIQQDSTDKKIFHITYKPTNVNRNSTIVFKVVHKNKNASYSHHYSEKPDTKLVKAYTPPIINSFDWSFDTQWELNTYTLTIDATDPQGLALTYQVTCNDSNVFIEQDDDQDFIFLITYPNYSDDVAVSFNISVTNEDNLTSTVTDGKTIHHFDGPVIEHVTWNETPHFVSHSYDMTITAHDPNNLDLYYGVTCNHGDVTIIQDTTNKNVFHITYPGYSSVTDVVFTVTVTNSASTSSSIGVPDTVLTEEAPIIDSVTWDTLDQWETRTYKLTINAHDPNNLYMAYNAQASIGTVTVVQDQYKKNVFHVTYPNFNEDTDVIIDVVAANTLELFDLKEQVINVKAFGDPVISGVSWKYSQGTDTFGGCGFFDYVTIHASDPGGFPLTYQLQATSNLGGHITIDTTNQGNNVFAITLSVAPGADCESDVCIEEFNFIATVTNSQGLSSTYNFKKTGYCVRGGSRL